MTAVLDTKTTDRGHVADAPQISSAPVGTDSESGAAAASTTVPNPPRSLFDPTLYVLAQAVDDFEGQRKAQDNRLRILTSTEPDEDGEVRGFGLDASHPVVGILLKQADDIKALEHQAILALNRVMRKHPLAAWQKSQKGVGEKQLARLLAAIGDPYMNEATGQPRTVSALWAYSGLHVKDGGAAKRQKGVKANWSTNAKTRAYLISTSCIKTDGEYRKVYDARREHTATTHPEWTPGHSHNDALRVVSKRILRDLWRAARDWHNAE